MLKDNQVIGYYVVENNYNENLNVLSVRFKKIKSAESFLNSNCNKNFHPNSFIIAELKNKHLAH